MINGNIGFQYLRLWAASKKKIRCDKAHSTFPALKKAYMTNHKWRNKTNHWPTKSAKSMSAPFCNNSSTTPDWWHFIAATRQEDLFFISGIHSIVWEKKNEDQDGISNNSPYWRYWHGPPFSIMSPPHSPDLLHRGRAAKSRPVWVDCNYYRFQPKWWWKYDTYYRNTVQEWQLCRGWIRKRLESNIEAQQVSQYSQVVQLQWCKVVFTKNDNSWVRNYCFFAFALGSTPICIGQNIRTWYNESHLSISDTMSA